MVHSNKTYYLLYDSNIALKIYRTSINKLKWTSNIFCIWWSGKGIVPEQELYFFSTQRRVHLKTSKCQAEPFFHGNKLVKFDDSLFYRLLILYTKCIYKTLLCTKNISSLVDNIFLQPIWFIKCIISKL